jgi:hypothetical protein
MEMNKKLEPAQGNNARVLHAHVRRFLQPGQGAASLCGAAAGAQELNARVLDPVAGRTETAAGLSSSSRFYIIPQAQQEPLPPGPRRVAVR